MLDALTLGIAMVGWAGLALVVVFAGPVRSAVGGFGAAGYVILAIAWWKLFERLPGQRRVAVAPFWGMALAALGTSASLVILAASLLLTPP